MLLITRNTTQYTSFVKSLTSDNKVESDKEDAHHIEPAVYDVRRPEHVVQRTCTLYPHCEVYGVTSCRFGAGGYSYALLRTQSRNDLGFFFFFQAEDGIRDLTVTGVQTCALPISAWITSRTASRGSRTNSGSFSARFPPRISSIT